MTNGRGSF